MSTNLQHTLDLLMFTCRYEQMKQCAVQTESAAGGICIKSLITASRETNRHKMLESSSSVLSLLFFWTEHESCSVSNLMFVFACKVHVHMCCPASPQAPVCMY